jgi:3-hydroxyisobutyrate dehydrogenase-like beta-hydroxyacid dehydrogenase
MLASIVELLGEAYSFVESNGVSPEAFYNLMSSTLLAAPAIKNYGRLILEGEFDKPGFTATLGAKDIFLVKETARKSKTPLPIASVVEDKLLRCLARGWSERDWTCVSEVQREDSGLK